jgi:phage anti-repressor protein
MQELIKITTDEQGLSVVSARELHSFLENGKRFADWIKNRIEKYGLVENRDYVIFSLVGEKINKRGRPGSEYALTLDTAKELAMVEGNAKGKQARQYFIQAEKALRQLTQSTSPPTLPTPEQESIEALWLQIQIADFRYHEQQDQLEELRADLTQILVGTQGRPVIGKGRPTSTPTAHRVYQTQLRAGIVQRVNQFCERCQYDHRAAYTYLYKRLSDVYGLVPYQLPRKPGESVLDALERHEYLDKLYPLAMIELIEG